jgi:hypothetical protein
MNLGIYSITFAATGSGAGIGLVVVDNGKIHGGDLSYLYRGRYDSDGSSVRATIHVSHYRGEPNSIFGPLRDFTLNLIGSAGDDTFNLSGQVQGYPQMGISIVAEKKANLFNG